MAIAFISANHNTPSSKVITGVSVTAGNLLLIMLYQDGADVETSVADNSSGGSNDYRLLAKRWVTGGSGCSIYLYACVAKATETLTITGTMAGSGYNEVFYSKYSGSFDIDNLVDVSNTKGETSQATIHQGASITTTVADTLLVCGWGEVSGSYTISEYGSGGFTERVEDVGTAIYDRIVSSTGSYYDTVQSTGYSYWASVLVAIKEASGGTNLACPTPSSLVATGLASVLALSLVVPTSNLALTPQTPSLRRTLAVPTSNLALTSQIPSRSVVLPAPASVSSLVLASVAPKLNRILAVPATNVTLTSLAPSRTVETLILCPSPIVLSIQSNGPTLGLNLRAPVPQTLSLTGSIPIVGKILQCVSPINLTLTSNTSNLLRTIACPVPSNLTLGSLGQNLSITLSQTSTPPSLTLTSFAPSRVVGEVLQAPSASLQLQSFAASLDFKLVPDTANLVTTTFAPILGTSGSIVVPLSNIQLTSYVPLLTSYASGSLHIPDHTYLVKFKDFFSCRIPAVRTHGNTQPVNVREKL